GRPIRVEQYPHYDGSQHTKEKLINKLLHGAPPMAEWINPLQEQEEPTWGDTLSNLSITAKRMVAGLGALGRHLGEDSESAFVRSLAAISRWVEEEASESAQR